MTKLKEKPLSEKITEAAATGNSEQLSMLIKQSENSNDYKEVNDYIGNVLLLASSNGHVECVKLLIPLLSDLDNGEALRRASGNGHADCVKILISVFNPKYGNSSALRWASQNGHAECVKLLIPLSEARDNESDALRCAAVSDNQKCVELLLPHSDISTWGIRECKYINFNMQHIIKSYFSKVSLMENVLSNKDKNPKTNKLRKI